MITSGVLYGSPPVAERDCTTLRQLIGNFRWGRGYYDIIHRPRNINWVPPGSDPIKSFGRPPVIQLAFNVALIS